jgi:hypothetical protein
MKNDDRRSRRVALVADAVMNPAPGGPDLLALIARRDWGVIGLPPERLGRPAIAQWLAGVADQIAEFRRHAMIVVAVLDPSDPTVAEELKRADAASAESLPVHLLSDGDADELVAFLDRRAE